MHTPFHDQLQSPKAIVSIRINQKYILRSPGDHKEDHVSNLEEKNEKNLLSESSTTMKTHPMSMYLKILLSRILENQDLYFKGTPGWPCRPSIHLKQIWIISEYVKVFSLWSYCFSKNESVGTLPWLDVHVCGVWGEEVRMRFLTSSISVIE